MKAYKIDTHCVDKNAARKKKQIAQNDVLFCCQIYSNYSYTSCALEADKFCEMVLTVVDVAGTEMQSMIFMSHF